MVKSMILTMSISGSVLFLLYILFLPLSVKIFSIRWRYGILKAALFLFLFPLPLFKYYIIDIGRFLFPSFKSEPTLGRMLLSSTTNVRIFTSEHDFFLSTDLKKIMYLLVIFLLISMVIIITQLFSYLKIKYCLNKLMMQPLKDEWLLDKIEQIKLKLNIKYQVKFYESDYLKNPMAIGIFAPTILFPSTIKLLSADKMEYIIYHELLHIKLKDLWIKLGGLLVIALHWYNPISYLLFSEICCISEICCDAQVVQNFEPEHKKEYGLLLIDMAMEKSVKENRYASVALLGSTKKITKRRIKELKRKNDKSNKILSALFAVIICTLASITSLAYEPAEEFEVADIGDWKDGDTAEIIFYSGEIVKSSLPYDFYFTDAKGQVYDIKENEENRKIACSHTYVSGELTKHTKDKNGGCKMQYFTSERCEKCGKTRNTVCYNTETNTTCPH